MTESHVKETLFILISQGTRGHNVVADGWAGAYNPHPHPHPPQTHSQTQDNSTKASKTRVFALFNSIITDGPTDRRTYGPTEQRANGPTDGQSLS